MMIRRLERADLDALLTLYAHLHAADAPLPDRATVEAVWDEALSSPLCHYFGLFDGDALVSSCTLTVIPNLTRGCRSYGLIENVVTHSDHRARGRGSSVVRHALDFAWQQNCYKVMLLTGRRDDAVFRFYRDLGFDGDAKRGFVAYPTQ